MDTKGTPALQACAGASCHAGAGWVESDLPLVLVAAPGKEILAEKMRKKKQPYDVYIIYEDLEI